MGKSRNEKKRARAQNNLKNAQGKQKPSGSSRKTVAPSATQVPSYRELKVEWDTSHLDQECGTQCMWSWDMSAKEVKTLLEFMVITSKRTWAEIEDDVTNTRTSSHRKHHGQPIDSLPRPALRRLEVAVPELKEAEEEIYRFRLGSTRRLWGFRSGHVFRLLWWDENHKVYPTEPKNT